MGFTSFWDKLFNPQKSAQNEPDDNVHIPTAQATIGCDVYDENGQHIDRTFDYRSGFHWVEEHPGHFVWLQLRDPNRRQMVHVGRVYDLHELLVEDCSTDHQRPKLEAFDDCLTLVARTLRYVDHEVIDNPADAVETGEVVLVAGKNYFISIQHGKGHSLDHVHKRLSHNPEDLAQGPMMCFYRAVDHVVDSYLKVAALMDNDIDDLEEEVFDPSTDIDIDEIYAVKREVLEIKHLISPLRTPLHELCNSDQIYVDEDIRSYFRDVEDHLLRAISDVHGFDEVLSSLIDAAAAKVGVEQNVISRALSAWAAIIAVPTLIVSIYGMNFQFMPLLQVDGAYYVVLALMAIWSITMYIVFRRKKWL